MCVICASVFPGRVVGGYVSCSIKQQSANQTESHKNQQRTNHMLLIPHIGLSRVKVEGRNKRKCTGDAGLTVCRLCCVARLVVQDPRGHVHIAAHMGPQRAPFDAFAQTCHSRHDPEEPKGNNIAEWMHGNRDPSERAGCCPSVLYIINILFLCDLRMKN